MMMPVQITMQADPVTCMPVRLHSWPRHTWSSLIGRKKEKIH
jgi:hypothetical protein